MMPLDTAVADDPQLLDALLHDAPLAPAIYQPTAYWRPYANRITAELHRIGFAAFRRNQVVLKGFAFGGTARATLPQKPWKRAAWHTLSRTPGVSKIVGEHERVIRALSLHLRRSQASHARLVLDRIVERFPHMDIPEGIANGGADDAFEWRGAIVTSDFVMHLARVADIYAHLDGRRITSILEIGPGLGLSTLAHKTLNPELRLAVNVDIVPTVYVSGRFLASIPSFDVIEYGRVRGHDTVALEKPETGMRVYALPSWMLPKVTGQVELALNAYSFQEMEEDVCANYARQIERLTTSAVMLHSTVGGHKAQAGGQRKAVTMAYLDELFEGGFPQRKVAGGLWTSAYDEEPGCAVLRTRT